MPSSGLIRQLRPAANQVDVNAGVPSAFSTVPTWMAGRSQENASASQTSGQLLLTGFHLPARARIDGIGFDVMNAGVSADFFVGLYDSVPRVSNGAGLRPGNLIVSAALPAITTTGQKLALVTPATLTPGIYWTAVLGVGTVTTLRQTWNPRSGLGYMQGLLNTNYLGQASTLTDYNSGNDPSFTYQQNSLTALPNSGRDATRSTISNGLLIGVWQPMRLAAA